ncbi:MAG: Uma2 family endonuclease [Anaerolineae bacterium]|nr:Uma2 family endonuclease [Anaerolineae bacterium]
MVERTRMTAAEYFALPETTQPMELINGIVIRSPSPTPRHQGIAGNVYALLRSRAKAGGGRAYMAPIDVVLDDSQVLQPDVVYLAPESRCQITERRLVGPPDLVVEVFSPGSVRRDKIDKFELYEACGVRETWMIDPHEQYIEVYHRDGAALILQGVYGLGAAFTSALLSGAPIPVDELLAD